MVSQFAASLRQPVAMLRFVSMIRCAMVGCDLNLQRASYPA